MMRIARTGCLLACLGAAAAAVLWWLSGDMPTGGLVRTGLFALAAVACHAVAAVLRRRGRD